MVLKVNGKTWIIIYNFLNCHKTLWLFSHHFFFSLFENAIVPDYSNKTLGLHGHSNQSLCQLTCVNLQITMSDEVNIFKSWVSCDLSYISSLFTSNVHTTICSVTLEWLFGFVLGEKSNQITHKWYNWKKYEKILISILNEHILNRKFW